MYVHNKLQQNSYQQYIKMYKNWIKKAMNAFSNVTVRDNLELPDIKVINVVWQLQIDNDE